MNTIVQRPEPGRPKNVGHTERWNSVLGGLPLLAFGLLRRSPLGLGAAAIGGALVYRGLTGSCLLYRALGINRAAEADEQTGNLGVKVERAVQFDESPEQLYAFWRNVRNLPTIMPHVDAVEVLSERRSRWRVQGPTGTTFQWDAEIITDRPNELIAWRTLPGGWVDHAGSVRFEPRAGGGTIVRVSLQYDPPGGDVAHLVAKLLGEDPGRRIEEDLERLKEALGRAGEDRDGLQRRSADALGYQR
jgi:uncharacterized membrane protein